MSVSTLERALREARVLVCAGTGGVGKTTIAASLAIQAACLGRRTLVLTIDPARRLADALGLDSLRSKPSPVDLSGLGEGMAESAEQSLTSLNATPDLAASPGLLEWSPEVYSDIFHTRRPSRGPAFASCP